MGNLSQLDFVLENKEIVKGPILEIGSKDYGNTNDFREFFTDSTFVGVDNEPGKGVDVVCDFTSDYESIKNKIGIDKFETVICLSTLEHCRFPHRMAENISEFLVDEGVIFVSVPFVWNIHAFPDDYWRFTPSSLSVLFSDCELIEEKSHYSTKIRGEKFPLTVNLANQERYMPGIVAKLLNRFGLMRTRYPYVLFPVLVNAVLVKKAVGRPKRQCTIPTISSRLILNDEVNSSRARTQQMRSDTLLSSIEGAKLSREYSLYLEARESVLKMMLEESNSKNVPSNYWEEELSGFDYMLDASPLIIQKLRRHCYHLTGLRDYDYRSHHAHKSGRFSRKLDLLRGQDTDDLLVPESPLLGGFGHAIDGLLINLDTLKFYESLIALNKAGLLNPVRNNKSDKKIVLEIGAGWGGFAYQFKKLCPNTCYVVIDFPQTLLFSVVYLRTLFPQARTFLYGDKPLSKLSIRDSYDFIFLPHYCWDSLQLSRIDLAINMVSFQEMTESQVDGYVTRLAELGCPHLYSHNRDRSSHNNQLSTVSSIIEKYYDIVESRVLDLQYTSLSADSLEQEQPRTIYDYRHLIGNLRK